MKYLLDTHILLWALAFDETLSLDAANIINDPENEIYYSVASIWEVTIKHVKNPEKMPITGRQLADVCEMADMVQLPILKEHAFTVDSLHQSEDSPNHNDPFDRMLIAQAKSENMLFLTHDSLLQYYNESCVLTV